VEVPASAWGVEVLPGFELLYLGLSCFDAVRTVPRDVVVGPRCWPVCASDPIWSGALTLAPGSNSIVEHFHDTVSMWSASRV
jgi:hypothetical protein